MLQREAMETYPGLAKALQTFLEFQFSFRGMIQHRISRHLDPLRPDRNEYQGEAKSAIRVQSVLKTSRVGVVYELGSALQQIASEPNLALHAMMEQFIDTVIRSEGARTQWQLLLDPLKADIWKQQFDLLGDHSKRRASWLGKVQQSKDALHHVQSPC
jgi:hypothetical protein